MYSCRLHTYIHTIVLYCIVLEEDYSILCVVRVSSCREYDLIYSWWPFTCQTTNQSTPFLFKGFIAASSKQHSLQYDMYHTTSCSLARSSVGRRVQKLIKFRYKRKNVFVSFSFLQYFFLHTAF